MATSTTLLISALFCNNSLDHYQHALPCSAAEACKTTSMHGLGGSAAEDCVGGSMYQGVFAIQLDKHKHVAANIAVQYRAAKHVAPL